MDVRQVIENFEKSFMADIIETVRKNEKRMIITIKPEAILRIAHYLYKTA
ncbi:MAG: hypothetical protein GT600_15410, partial [Bacteroidales bacterium]|nr:hypothetical protein [Bacteroidales bacterium]